MTPEPLAGAFPHQHGDPRGLRERIQAQLRARIEEAVELAGLKLLVDLRERHGRPAPETSSTADRREFEETARGLLTHLSQAFRSDVGDELAAGLARAEATAPEERERLLLGQVFLASRLPDYWQRFEAYRLAYCRARLESPAPGGRGWLGRLLGGA